MSRCKATSPSEHRDSSTEALEHRDSVIEASEWPSTERRSSVHAGSKWVNECKAPALMVPAIEEFEDIR